MRKTPGNSRTMQPIRYLCLVVLLLLPFSVAFGQDREPTPAKKALERLENALQKEQGLNPETKDALQDLVGALRAEREERRSAFPETQEAPQSSKGEIAKIVDEYLTARPPDLEKSSMEKVMERLSFHGDLRLRHETNTELDDQPTQNRQRVRFRLGANYQLTDEILLGARLATGNRLDPNSPHQTLGDVFRNFDVNLDRAFVTYRPEWADGLWATAGKFAHPFWPNPVYGELVWDSDVQPEGAALGYSFKNLDLGFLQKIDLTVGEYVILEQRLADEASAFVAQLSAHGKFGEHWKPSVAFGYYRYADLTPDDSGTVIGDNAGNATVGAGPTLDFRSRFEILNPIVALSYEGWKYPLAFSGEYILNTRADIDEDQGWAIGASVGSSKKKGDWKLYYQWQVVEQDAVLSVFSQDDFLFQTNHRSHVLGANYQISDKIGLHLWGLVSERYKTFPGATTDSDADQWRLRLDINIKF